MKTIKYNDNKLQSLEFSEQIGEEITFHGYIYKVRRMSGFSFVLVKSSSRVIQCVCDTERDLDVSLTEGACANFTGVVRADERSRAGYEIDLTGIEILSAPEGEYPVVINNKELNIPLDLLLDTRPVSLRNQQQSAMFKIQEGVSVAFCAYMRREGFTRIFSPKLVQSGAEGGANMFRLDYFGGEACLAQSPQLYKQIMVGVFERVYEIAPVFRAEKFATNRHLNEYTSLDAELGYINSYEDIMSVLVGFLQYLCNYLQKYYSYELELLKVDLPVIGDIPVLRFDKLKALARENGCESSDPHDLSPDEERFAGEYIKNATNSRFVFVTHYPSSVRPFYTMDDPENTDFTLSFDLLIDGLEMVTGGQRVHNYQAQINKMRSREMDPAEFEGYLMAHKNALPPHGGFGLGLERLCQKLLGQPNLRYCTLFPRDRYRLTP